MVDVAQSVAMASRLVLLAALLSCSVVLVRSQNLPVPPLKYDYDGALRPGPVALRCHAATRRLRAHARTARARRLTPLDKV